MSFPIPHTIGNTKVTITISKRGAGGIPLRGMPIKATFCEAECRSRTRNIPQCGMLFKNATHSCHLLDSHCWRRGLAHLRGPAFLLLGATFCFAECRSRMRSILVICCTLLLGDSGSPQALSYAPSSKISSAVSDRICSCSAELKRSSRNSFKHSPGSHIG